MNMHCEAGYFEILLYFCLLTHERTESSQSLPSPFAGWLTIAILGVCRVVDMMCLASGDTSRSVEDPADIVRYTLSSTDIALPSIIAFDAASPSIAEMRLVRFPSPAVDRSMLHESASTEQKAVTAVLSAPINCSWGCQSDAKVTSSRYSIFIRLLNLRAARASSVARQADSVDWHD